MSTARSELRLVPAIDTYPSLIRLAQTPAGKLGVIVVFALGLILHQKAWWLEMSVLLAALSFWPGQRRWWVLAGTGYWLTQYTEFGWGHVRRIAESGGVIDSINWPLLEGASLVAALLFCAGFYAAARAWPRSGPMRRPIATLLASYVALLFVAYHAPMPPMARTAFWAFLVALGRYLWFLGFSLLDRSARDTPKFWFQLGYYLPFWMGNLYSSTPMPKGTGNLRRIEVRNSEERAVYQLKALKLIFWAAGAIALRELLVAIVHGSPWSLPLPQPTFSLSIPTFDEAFALSLSSSPPSWYTAWSALVARFFYDLLSLAGVGHLVISICRMAGYRALRNSYRPLRSASVADFWNRYYFYFKELLVDFFFYPVYLRYFKGYPRVRLFAATLSAAFFGNVLFHYLRDTGYIMSHGPWEALVSFRVYFIYALVLASAIGISQNRSHNPQRHWLRKKVLGPLSVVAFYCVLSVFNSVDRSQSVADHFIFLATLVGMGGG